MAFKIELYNNRSEKNRIGKTLEETQEYEGNLRDETSVTSPIIMIENNGFPEGNYAYISLFNRYYFITDITSIRNNIWQLSLKCDVLESFKSSILSCNAILDRQEQDYNLYIPDEKVPVQSDTITVTKVIGNKTLSAPSIILTSQG